MFSGPSPRGPPGPLTRAVVAQPSTSPTRVLGVFGLSQRTHERKIETLFGKYGKLEKVALVIDRKTAVSRGFAFITFEDLEDAKDARVRRCFGFLLFYFLGARRPGPQRPPARPQAALDGLEVDERKIRVDFSMTQKAHTPTPGVYKGVPTCVAGRPFRSSPATFDTPLSVAL